MRRPRARANQEGRAIGSITAEPSHIPVGGDDQQCGEKRIAHEGIGEHEGERVEQVGRGRRAHSA